MRLANSLQPVPKLSRASLLVLAFLQKLLPSALLLIASATAFASGPRWFSGPPYFNTWYTRVAWYTTQPAYFTDPGDLSAAVNHATADAMVAQAASVWNIPTASLVLTRGGSLSQHVSGANISAGTTGLNFPTDVQPANYQAKQIAVIYDSDGSVTDLLLGSGASDPSGCLQNGVTESVDLISPSAQILHALLILNGRCTGSEPQKQLQMQYQLERAFGRILGLSWSQTNDNVFTGSPAPSANQAANWPIMHPIDIVCGPYTYQCLPQPFTLRPDDISSLESLYFIQPGQAGPGKQASWTNAGGVYGAVSFPNGQGMEGVNVVVRRRAPFWDTAEDWEVASAVSGYGFRGETSTSITAPDTSIAGSVGSPGTDWAGNWFIQSVPVPASQAWTDLVVSTEAVNPLYIGPYAIGPQSGDTMNPSGSPQTQVSMYLANGRNNMILFAPSDASASCPVQGDGTESAPAAVAEQGWWSGTLCGYNHQAWASLAVKSSRSFTVELTALDEQGAVTLNKAMPIIGVWKLQDATGTLPTVAVATKAFNGQAVGVTSLRVQSSTANSYRIAVADQRGAGRPDFAYQARILYADSVQPTSLPANGGTITISGMGFRQGNSVLINGTVGTVLSVTSTTIVATAPSLHTLGLSRRSTVSVTVQDASTGGTSIMSAALTYAAPVEALQLVTAPSGSLPSGTSAPTPFSVQAIAPDGFTPIVGEAVSFTATGAVFSACGASSCTVYTNVAGLASASVTPTAPGTVNLAASGRSGSVNAAFTATGSSEVIRLLSAPAGVNTVGAVTTTPLRAQLLAADGITPRVGSALTLTVTSGAARFSGCSATPCVLTTDAQGTITSKVTPSSSGNIAMQVASASSSVAASFSAAPETIRLQSAPIGTQTVGISAANSIQIKVLAGDGVTPMFGEAVVFTATGGSVSFGACGSAICTVTTDAQGLAQSSVTPLSAGTITLSATGTAGAVTSSFSSVAPRDLAHLLSSPTGTAYVGDTASALFTIRVTSADGTTPVAGKPVTFTSTTAAAIFGACGATTCTVSTDSTGLASTSVSPTSAGQLTLLATSEAGAVSAAFTAAVRLRSITASQSVLYIAEGAMVSWSPEVVVTDNSAPVADVPVVWAGGPGMRFTASSNANAAGIAAGNASLGPIASWRPRPGFRLRLELGLHTTRRCQRQRKRLARRCAQRCRSISSQHSFIRSRDLASYRPEWESRRWCPCFDRADFEQLGGAVRRQRSLPTGNNPAIFTNLRNLGSGRPRGRTGGGGRGWGDAFGCGSGHRRICNGHA